MDESNYIEMDLCGACKALLEEDGRKVKTIRHGADQKVTCSVCFRKRYGGKYAVSKEVKA